MAKKREARFIISAENKTAATISKITGDVSKMGGAFKKLGSLIGPALAGLATGAAVKGFASMIQQANDLTDSLRDSSIRLGIGIADLQAYQLAAGNAGIEAGALTGILGKLNKAAGEIKLGTGSDKTIEAFSAIGVSVEEIQKSNPAQLFESVIEGLGGVADPASRAALAMQIFGKSGQTALTLVADGAGSLRESRGLLDELGLSLSQIDGDNVDRANDAIGTLSFVAEAAKQKIGAELAPKIAELSEKLLKAGTDGESMGKGIEKGVAGAVGTLDKIVTFTRAMGGNLDVVRLKLLELVSAIGVDLASFAESVVELVGNDIPRAFAALLEAGEKALTNLEQGFRDFGTAISNSVIGAMNSIIGAIEGMVNKALPALNKVIQAANSANPFGGAIPDLPSASLERISPEGRTKVRPYDFGSSDIDTFGEANRDFLQGLQDDLGRKQISYAADAAQAAEDASAAWDDFLNLYKEGAVLPPKPLEDTTKALDTATGSANDLAGALGGSSGGKGSVAGSLDDVRERARGMEEDMIRAAESSTAAFNQMYANLAQYGEAVTSGLTSAIDQFVQSGKLNLKEFARSVLADLAAIAAKAAILGGIFGNSQYGGNNSGLVGTFLSGILSGGFNVSGAPRAVNISTGQSYAGGGFTGMGSRSGGVDGKGGFPAILHPNETVVDHAAGQSMGGGTTINQTIMVRETLPSGIAAQIAKQASQQAQAALKNISDRGGNRRRSFRFA